jgi:hypothetical protein
MQLLGNVGDTDLREVVEDPYEGWIVVLLLSKLLQ